MKKKNIREIDFLSSVGVSNVQSITSLIKRTKQPSHNVDQYVLLVNNSNVPTGFHTGLISFAKNSYDMSWTSLFAIHKTIEGAVAKSYGDTLSFFSVNWNGVVYIAIKKPHPAINFAISLISMITSPEAVFELINADQLTDITPL